MAGDQSHEFAHNTRESLSSPGDTSSQLISSPLLRPLYRAQISSRGWVWGWNRFSGVGGLQLGGKELSQSPWRFKLLYPLSQCCSLCLHQPVWSQWSVACLLSHLMYEVNDEMVKPLKLFRLNWFFFKAVAIYIPHLLLVWASIVKLCDSKALQGFCLSVQCAVHKNSLIWCGGRNGHCIEAVCATPCGVQSWQKGFSTGRETL